MKLRNFKPTLAQRPWFFPAVVAAQLALLTLILIGIPARLQTIKHDKAICTDLRRSLMRANLEISRMDQMLFDLLQRRHELPGADDIIRKHQITPPAATHPATSPVLTK